MGKRLKLPPSLRAIQSPETLRALDSGVRGCPTIYTTEDDGTVIRCGHCGMGVYLHTCGFVHNGVASVIIHGLRLRSLANWRPSTRERIAYPKMIRAAVMHALGFVDAKALAFKTSPCMTRAVVTVTRVGPRLLDDDNATASAKATRDEVAAWLGVDDGDGSVRWEVAQERGPYAVKITVKPTEATEETAVGTTETNGLKWRKGVPTREQVTANEGAHPGDGETSMWLARPWGAVMPMVAVACWEQRPECGGPCVRWDAALSPDGLPHAPVRLRPDESWWFMPMHPQTWAPRSWVGIDAAVGSNGQSMKEG